MEVQPVERREPQVSVTKKDVHSWIETHLTLDYTVTLIVDGPMITDAPNESECKNVQITLNGFYQLSSIPVIEELERLAGRSQWGRRPEAQFLP
jgi:hypothetical protein